MGKRKTTQVNVHYTECVPKFALLELLHVLKLHQRSDVLRLLVIERLMRRLAQCLRRVK